MIDEIYHLNFPQQTFKQFEVIQEVLLPEYQKYLSCLTFTLRVMKKKIRD